MFRRVVAVDIDIGSVGETVVVAAVASIERAFAVAVADAESFEAAQGSFDPEQRRTCREKRYTSIYICACIYTYTHLYVQIYICIRSPQLNLSRV